MSTASEETPLTAPEETPTSPPSTENETENDATKTDMTTNLQDGAKAAAAKTAEVSKIAAAKTVEYSKKGAAVAKEKATEMADFVMDGPIGFRFIAFLGGLAVVGMSITDMVEFNIIFNPWQAVTSLFHILFGFVIMMLESNALFKRTPWRKDIYEKCAFLRTTFGRGVFYVFVGVNMAAQNFAIFSFFTGIYVFVVGIIFVLVGYYTQRKLTTLHEHLKDTDAVIAAFDEVDIDETGSLDPEEFAELCETLGVPMNKVELLAVFEVIDTSDVEQRKNRITKEEFLHWWSEWDELAEVV